MLLAMDICCLAIYFAHDVNGRRAEACGSFFLSFSFFILEFASSLAKLQVKIWS